MAKRLRLLLLVFAFLTNSCGDNILRDMSTKDSADALYEDAMKLATNQKYDDAFIELAAIASRYPDYASTDTFKISLAGVQAGQCGLNFINFINGVTSAAGSQMFMIMMQTFRGIAVRPTKCVDAQATMKTMSNLKDDQLLFLAVLGMTKMGSYLRDRADRTGGTGDGTVDGGFDACATATSATTLDDDDMKEVVTGFGLTLQNFALIGGSFAGSSASASIDAINAFCNDPDGNGNNSDAINCSITDASAVDAVTIRVFRRLLDSSAFGLGSCDISGNPLGCCPGLPFP